MNAVMHGLIVGCVNDAIKNEHGRFVVNEKGFEKMLMFGSTIDLLASKMDIHNVGAAVRTGTRAGMVSFEVDELVLERGASDPLFKAIRGASSIGFSKSKDGMLVVTATFEGVLVDA